MSEIAEPLAEGMNDPRCSFMGCGRPVVEVFGYPFRLSSTVTLYPPVNLCWQHRHQFAFCLRPLDIQAQ